MGPSGSGKTTFIGVLSGLDAPDSGEVRWKGRPVAELSAEERMALRRGGMGIVFQSFGLLPTLSAVENVELPLRVSDVEPEEARARARPGCSGSASGTGCRTARSSSRRASSSASRWPGRS